MHANTQMWLAAKPSRYRCDCCNFIFRGTKLCCKHDGAGAHIYMSDRLCMRNHVLHCGPLGCKTIQAATAALMFKMVGSCSWRRKQGPTPCTWQVDSKHCLNLLLVGLSPSLTLSLRFMPLGIGI